MASRIRGSARTELKISPADLRSPSVIAGPTWSATTSEMAVSSAFVCCQYRLRSNQENPTAAIRAETTPPPAIITVNFRLKRCNSSCRRPSFDLSIPQQFGADGNSRAPQCLQADLEADAPIQQNQIDGASVLQKFVGLTDGQRMRGPRTGQGLLDFGGLAGGQINNLATMGIREGLDLKYANGPAVHQLAFESPAQDRQERCTADDSDRDGLAGGRRFRPFGVPQKAEHDGRFDLVYRFRRGFRGGGEPNGQYRQEQHRQERPDCCSPQAHRSLRR